MNTTFNTYLFDEITYQSVKEVFIDLSTAEKDESVKKVVITICSWGGLYLPAYALYDRLKTYPKKVEIIATGVCQSSALLILQAGSKRIATEHTVLLLHQTNNEFGRTNFNDVVKEVDQYKKEHNMFIELSISRSKIDKKKFEELIIHPTFLTPREALEMGFIDEIIEG